jgi:transcription elongation GreA/GreB family factor
MEASMTFYFLPDDLQRLGRRITEVEEHIRAVGREMGESCTEGAETFHDNFAYEDGERQLIMWTRRLRELHRVRERARAVTPGGPAEFVRIGRVARVLEIASGRERTFRIGSYMVFNGDPSISYASPLGRLLVGAQEGDLREGIIAGERTQIEILEVLPDGAEAAA